MPTLTRLSSTRIVIFANDHNPPHFHILGAGFAVLVEIGSWRVIGEAGKAGDIAEALIWARANEAALRTAWNELNDGRL